MKTLKFVVVVAVVAALGMTGVTAVFGTPEQDIQSAAMHPWLGDMLNPDDMAEVLASHLQEQLSLTDEQKAEIVPILKTNIEKRMTDIQARRAQIRENLQTTAADRQAQFQELETELSGILTEEQMQTLRQTVEENWGPMLDMRAQVAEGNFPERGRAAELLQELNPTLEQKKQLFGIAMKYRGMHQDTRDEMQAVRKQVATTMLDLLNSDEFDEARVRQTFQESAAKLEDVVVSGAKMLSEMKAILTPEQQEILQQKGAEFLEQMQAGGIWGQRFGFRNHFSQHRPLFSFRFRQVEK